MYSDKPHTNVIKRGDTPRFWRLFLSAIMMRYGIIESVGFIRDAFFWKTDQKMEWLKQHVDATAKPIVNPPTDHDFGKPWDALKDGIKRYGLNEEASHINELHKAVKSRAESTDALWNATNATAELKSFEDHVNANIRANEHKKFDTLTNRISDSLNGVLSIGITLNNVREVYKNIRSVFTEAVAYDINKSPQKVTFGDLFHSKNVLVKRTFRNLVTYSAWRLATDALFFLRWVLPGVNGTYAGIGAKGALLTAELMSNRYTFYERVVDFATTRLDVASGAGKNISGDDLASLYQGAAFENPSIVSLDGPEGPARQAGSAPVFKRMAELMKKSYLKSSRDLQPANGRGVLGDFELPEFLFLLGNDYLDASNPRLSIAYVEVANAHGIAAVKKMRQMIGAGASISQCLETFPVTLEPVSQQLLGPAAAKTAALHAPVQSNEIVNGTEKIIIETRDGEVRNFPGVSVSRPLSGNYGRVEGVMGADGEGLDIYINNHAMAELNAGKPYQGKIFVMQKMKDGAPDELKVGYAADVNEFRHMQASTWENPAEFTANKQGRYIELTHEQYQRLKESFKENPQITVEQFAAKEHLDMQKIERLPDAIAEQGRAEQFRKAPVESKPFGKFSPLAAGTEPALSYAR